MGIPWAECSKAGEILGTKMVFNEFLAYIDLGRMKDDFSPRTYMIMTYALCGFANFSSIGIQLGGIGGIAPERPIRPGKTGRACDAWRNSCRLYDGLRGRFSDQRR